ncbi:CynX/NimT family MFS transporter [Gordonia bronchialis]|uniref:CynX/NimT family MFS transporter n=1 Tax=Gordonia bronchialis TaxID=2054 RepID=UPI002270EC81|nr:MFS transporter [Gordonia bronchialis]
MTATRGDRTHARTRSSLLTIVTAAGIMLVAANLRPAVVAVAPLIDDISAEEGFSSATAGMLTTLPVLFFGLSAPVAPRLAARFGIERTIFGSMILLIAGILLRWVPNATALFAGSAIIGVAIGICNVVLPALIKRDFAHRSGLMTGLYSMTLSGGAAVAAAVTIPIDDAFDGNWRLTLASWAVLAVIALVIWLPQLTRMHVVVPVSGGSLWTNRVAWAVTAFMGAQSLVFYTFTAWLPAYLVDQGHSRGEAGLILAAGQVVALTASLVAPIIAGRFADQRLITFIVVAVSAVGLIGLITTGTLVVLWIVLVLIGPGSSIGLALLFMVLRSRDSEQTGRVSGMAQSVGYVLAAVGPIALGAIHDWTHSWTTAFCVLLAGLAVQAGATTLAAKDVQMTA